MRSILITGGNGGLGLGIGRYFLEKDPEARVWLGVRANRTEAAALAAEYPGRCRTVDLEVTSKEAWENAIATVLESDGRLDVLVNNAGMHRDHLLAAMPDEAWSSVISANLDAVFLGCRAVIRPMMSQRFGRIVNISSGAGIFPRGSSIAYAVSKAGLNHLTQCMAVALAPAVTVNCVAPGFMEGTRMTANQPVEYTSKVPDMTLLRHAVDKDDVAEQVVLFCRSDSVTGQTLLMDCGRL